MRAICITISRQITIAICDSKTDQNERAWSANETSKCQDSDKQHGRFPPLCSLSSLYDELLTSPCHCFSADIVG